MTSAIGRIASGSRNRSSAMAMPTPLSVNYHPQLQHRTVPFGTSWPCTSPPSILPAGLSNNPILSHSVPSSPGAHSQRGNLVIVEASCSALGGSVAYDVANSTTARRRGNPGQYTHAHRSILACPPHTAFSASSGLTSTAAGDVVVSRSHGLAAAASKTPFPMDANIDLSGSHGQRRGHAPARRHVRVAAVANAPPSPSPYSARSAGSSAAGPGTGPGGGGATSPTRPPSPSSVFQISYFDGFCPEGATECSLVWEQLRWCSKWQQLRQVYENLLRTEAEAVAAAQATSASGSGSSSPDSNAGGFSTSVSVDRPVSFGCAPGFLSRDETYAFLLQLQDFYHLKLDHHELEELQAFRCRLVRDLAVYVRQLNAEQLEALCCASAVSGKCLTRERADAVQQRLLKILSSSSPSAKGKGYSINGNGNRTALSSESSRRLGRDVVAGGFQVLTPALNTIFALYDHGYLPQVALLQAVFRQAVDHCGEVTRSQWHGLHGLARRFRFLLDDTWLEDLHAYLREPLSCAATDFGRMASILGCISAFTVNKAMEALDTRVLVVVEAIERRYDEGRSLLTAHQLVVFTALLVDMQSHFRSKWLGLCLDYLGSCRSHLAGLPPSTLVLAVEIVLRGRGWLEQRLLSKLLRQLFSTYTRHPAAALRNASSNVSGCPPRAASRIISSSPSDPFSVTSLSAKAAAAAWDVDVGGSGGAASPALDLGFMVDWLASKVPLEPGPERSDTLEFLQPLVSALVEDGRPQLASLEPRRLPGLIRSVAVLGVSPSREWVSEAFAHVAGGAAELSSGELVAMLRLSHAQGVPLPHATLDAVCSQYARILPLMRAVDLCRLLECWVADRYMPSREQLEGFFDSVCDSFGIDLAVLKAAAAGGTAPRRLMESSFDTDSASLPLSRGSSGGDAGRTQDALYLDFEMLQVAGGSAVSAGAADGVAGSFNVWRITPQPVKPSAVSNSGVLSTVAVASTASNDESRSPPPSSAAVSTMATAASTIAAATVITAAATAATTTTTDLRSRFKAPSLGSLDGRPNGAPLQPAEAQSMLTLLDQYRALLLEAKRSNLLVVMNTYRNAVTAALHDMCKTKDNARNTHNSRLLQAVLHGGEV